MKPLLPHPQRRFPAALLALVVLALPKGTAAEGSVVATPSLTIAEAYDDNIFSSPTQRESDYITRLGPGFEGGYRSPAFTFLGRGSIEGERFSDRPFLNTVRARDTLGVDFNYHPKPSLTLRVAGSHVDTLAPDEFTLLSGLSLGRQRAREEQGKASLTTQSGARQTWDFGYGFTRDQLPGVFSADTHEASLTSTTRLTSLDSGSLSYQFRWYVFDGRAQAVHIALAGWKRQLGPHTQLALAGGPAFSQGSVVPQAQASLTHTMAHGEFSVQYDRILTTVVGLFGPVAVDSASLRFREVPWGVFRLGLVPEVYWDRLGSFTARVFRLSSELGVRIAHWLTLAASHQLSHQEGSLGSPLALRIDRSVVLVSLVVSPEAWPRPQGPKEGPKKKAPEEE
jgi:hypothetical protein